MNRTVPVEYQGLWRRTGIWRSDGSSDLSTQVWWFQSSSFHVDLRIPADRPRAADADAVARLSAAQRQRFNAQTGFAGLTVVEGARCTWHPALAFPAISDQLDAGWMRFDSPDRLHETGVDHSYDEDWVRVSDDPMQGVRLEEVNGDAVAYLLIGAQWMAWACGNKQATSSANAIQATRWNEFSVLQKQAQWTIGASNLPWREGVRFADDHLTAAQVRQWRAEDLIHIALAPDRQWRIIAKSP